MLASPQFLIGLLHIKPTQLLLNRESTGAFDGDWTLTRPTAPANSSKKEAWGNPLGFQNKMIVV
jgi:hypothetical protein